MDATTLLTQNRTEIEHLCSKYGVTKLRLFGSALTSDWDPEKSDIDFAAEFTDPPEGVNRFQQYFGLLVEMEQLLKSKVDLVDWNAVTKAHFKEHVDRNAVTWYAA
jgi:predicted nucleotidyltransferase